MAKAEDNVKVEYIRFMIRSAEESQYQELDTIKAVSDRASYSLDTTRYQDGAYYINAVAIDGNGNESIEEYFKKFVIDNTGLSRTESVEVVPYATYATVKWKDVKDTDFGYFQVEMLKDGEFVPVATETKRLFADVNGLLPETSYTFRVVGYDAIGNRGQESEEVNIVTTADTTSPVIKCVSPVSLHYSVLISLSQMAEDNLGVEKGVFSYSYDGENYNEIGEVYTDEKKKQEEINIDFDISALAEGTIYIKFQAYDTAGNKSEDVVNTYVVDRTAPDVVKNPVEISCNGVAGISWDAPKEDDVDYYIIYRMEKDTGIFRKIEEKCTSIGYYDMNVACGESYRYKICAVDTAGNVSRMSDEVAVTISDDMEAPTVKKIVPSDGSTIGKNQTIKVPVIDNDKIRSVTLEYKGSSKDDIWHTIATDYVNDMIKCCEFTWNTEGLKEGKYSLRAWAEDVSGNISSPYEVTYTLDMTAPEPPEISAKTGYFQVQLNISKPVDKDFSHFEIYRKNVGSTNFELIGDTIGVSDDKSYIDKSVEPYDNYEYKVRSYDMYGNYSESNTVIGNADDIDTIKPVARFSETTMGMTGMEVSFDGSGSTDNSRVTEYTWDFGDGTPKEHGAQVRHVYKEVGTYIVKLTVADAHGNVAYTVGTVVIYDKDAEVGTVEIRFEEEDGCQLPYTIAYFNRGNNDKFTQFADCNGELRMTTEEGVYEMAVYVRGYMPMTTTFTVSRYKENKIIVRLKKGEMIKSEITARKMEIWDILNMGVDLENEANYNKVSYSVTLWFAETPIPVTVECTGAPGGGGSKELRVFNSNCTDKPQGSGGYTDYTIKIKEHEDERTLICLGVSQTISWLKDMYYVNLSVSNMAEPEFYIKDVIVELELPEELGLAYISDKFNDKFNKENGFLFNQEEYTSELLCSGDTLSYDWVVSGTKPGNFNIGARLMGCLMPVDIKLNERLSAECEIQVNSGEGLIMNIMAENAAYNGEFYYIYFTLINKSSNTFYNLEFSFEDKDGLEKTKQKFYLKDNDSAVPVVSAQDMIQVGVMKPGTELHGVYTTVMDTENEDTYFQFVKSLASTWEAENMGIKVFFNTIPSHSSRSIVEYEDLSMSYYGDPVDVTRGAFTDSKELMALNGFSTLSLDLEYDSGSRYTQSKGEVGYGWSTNYESYIEEHNGIITFHPSPSESAVFISKKAIDENKKPFRYNEEIVYEDETYGEYLCENKDMYDYTLTKNQDGTYIIYAPSKERYYYNESGKLTEIMDSSGRCVSLSYGMNQKIVTDDVSGMRMKLNYNTQGLLTSIEDDNGRHAYIIYDENDCIASITDESGYTMSYAYDEYKRIIKEKSNTGDIILKNEYDDEGYICRQVTATGQDTHYTYKKDEETKLRYVTINTDGAVSSVTVDTANHIIEETNANGSCTSYTYDSHGNQTCEKDNYGNTVMKRYDSSGNIIELYDTFANCTKYSYDENGNVTRIESPDGKIAKYEYNKNNLVTKSTDASGKVTTYKYDGNGQLIEETVEGLGSAHYRYQNGRMVSATDYMGNTTLTQYDGMGNVIKKTDPVGAVTSYSYDNSGRIKSVTDALGNTTTYEYDKNGNKKSETDAQGNVIKYEYDLAGNNTKIIDADGTETTYEYDKNGNNIKTTYADGSKDIFKYDAVNNITYRKLADGTENKYKYDALNQIINETDADGNQTHYEYYPNGKVYKVQYSDGQSELYTYNSRWQNTCVTDQNGNTTSYTYDDYGNVTTTTNPLGHQQKNEYDKFGRMLLSTDANGNITRYKYDAAGKCTSVTYPDGSVTGYEYDGAGRTLKEIRYADGTKTVTASYTYDLLGRQTSVTDAEGVTQYTEYDYRGNVVSISDSESIKIQENKYDAAGKLILTIDGEGRKTEYEYTKTGKVSRASENPDTKEEKTTLYGYDTAGRINKVTDAIDGVSECTYDTTGRISSVKEPEGGVTKYKYDTRGRIIKEINAVGGEKTYTYNTNGTLKQEVNGRKQNTLYKYDAAGRVIKRTDNAGKKNEYTVEYTYDNVGNILTVDDGKGVIIRTYDCMNRVTSYTDYKGNTVKYAYDESGNLISLTYPGGEIVRYTYYENGKPQTVTDYKGRKTTYAYDKNGRLSVVSRPDGSSETYTYDRQGRIRTQKDKKASGEVIHEYRYTYDTSGNITQIKGTDNSTALSKMETAVMEYDAANRLIKYNGKEVKYDADGNMTYGPLNGRMVHMEYDSRNRLVKAGNTEFEYDAEDVRTAVQTPEYREEYVTDNEGTLSQVLTATRYKSCGDGIYSTEGTDTKYVYGNGLISEEYRNIMPVSQEETEEGISSGTEQDVAEDNEIYLLHHYNNTGSTTQVTDIDGNVVAEYVYGTYGEADKVSGDESINSRYLYNGMYGVSTDENGLYYMRTRYYNVGIKRFINADIEKGDISNSQSLNRYCYVQGNPISFTDPFGLSPAFNLESFAHGVLDFLGCFPVIGTIADIAQAVMYANEGDTFNMSLCIISAVSSGVASVGKLAVKCGKLAKATKYISTGARLIENAAVFTVSAGQAAETARGMWKKYAEDKQPVGAETLGEVATLGLSIFAAGTSAKSFGMNGNKLKSMAVKEKLGRNSNKVTDLASYYEYKALRQQGYNATEAYDLMKQFRSGKNPNSEFAFHFTTLKGGKGITDTRQIIASNTGVRGAGVYAGRTPTPSWLLKHLPWSGWGLGHTPVRIPIRIEGYMNGRKLNYPLKSMKFDCESLKY
ncbi:MAG: PKD domain-containing protein [Lachnospiraceae bacterium]|nr:PKD domain-containing protein [Lachnospiraceae bacterium]